MNLITFVQLIFVLKTSAEKTFYYDLERHSRSALSNRMLADYLIINTNDSHRTELLNRYLSAKIYSHSDKIHILIAPEVRNYFGTTIPILPHREHNRYDFANTNSNNKQNSTKYRKVSEFGFEDCSIEILAMKNKIPVSVCPWHWIYIERKDRYPFMRPYAKCNCPNCQAKTIFDSDGKKMSRCRTENVLLPVLLREYLQVNGTEKWAFHLEEIPVMCTCSINLKPYFRH